MRNKIQMKAARKLLKKTPGPFKPVNLNNKAHTDGITRAFQNNRYVVMINDQAPMTQGVTGTRVMVQRHDDAVFPNHWQELQNIKNELFGREATAIEYFPAESALSDAANIYWMWILPADELPLAVL